MAVRQPLVVVREVIPPLGLRAAVQEQGLLAAEPRMTPVSVFVGHVADPVEPRPQPHMREILIHKIDRDCPVTDRKNSKGRCRRLGRQASR
jgi:hypothetical protein